MIWRLWFALLVALAGLLACGMALADVRLAGVFGDHMVLQREQPVRVWGWARPGEAVQVRFRQQTLQTQADAQGAWQVNLAPEAAGGPHTLQVSGENTLRVVDVLVGEVWLASGQSNMEWPLQQAEDGAAEVARASHPWLRQITVPKTVALQPRVDIDAAPWRVATPQTAGEFSAVAYHFALRLHAALGVPVGIVNMSWGGTHVETWSRPQALATLADFSTLLRDMPATPQAFMAQRQAAQARRVARWQHGLPMPVSQAEAAAWAAPAHDDRHWPGLQAPQVWEEQGLEGFDGVLWYRREVMLSAVDAAAAQQGATLHLGPVDDCDETWVNGQRVGGLCQWDRPRSYAVPAGLLKAGRNVMAVRVTDSGGGGGFHGAAADMRLQLPSRARPLAGRWRARVESVLQRDTLHPNDLPGLLYHGMVAPVQGYALRGAIWYQGESNAGRAAQYAQSFPLLIEDWRRQWGQGAFPFLFVQLAPFNPSGRVDPEGSTWAELRESQRQTLALPHTGMAVTLDIGDRQDIHPRNKHDVGARLALLALKQVYGHKDVVAEGPVMLGHRVRGAAIEVKFRPSSSALALRGAAADLRGFEVAGADRRFRPAQAVIEGERVRVWHGAVARPMAVRYAWQDDPGSANLMNAAGLPAGPLRTDSWPLRTRGVKFSR